MGIYIGCIFENTFNKRNDLEESKSFMLRTIDILKEHYNLHEDAFRIDIDEENDRYTIETDSLQEISGISLCNGAWCVELSQKYGLLFFSDLYYLNMLKEIAITLEAKEMWVCDDLQIWRGDFWIYNQCLTKWMEYLRGKGIENIQEFPATKELSDCEDNGTSHFPYDAVYHVDLMRTR